MGITDEKLQFCHGISNGSDDKNIQQESTTSVRFINASIISFQIIVVTQI